MIREAMKKDVTFILDIYNDAILNSTAVYAYKPVTLENRIDWYEQKKADGYPILVYELDNKVVGFATFGPFRHGLPINIQLNILCMLIRNIEKMELGPL